MAIKSVKQLVEEANREIVTLEPSQAIDMHSSGNAVLVDIRDVRELQRDGRVPDSVHAPRGMLEFWFDPSSPYHKLVFAQADKTYILYCAAGWRSALATKTLKDMGFDKVAHVAGGFGALKELGVTVEPDHDWEDKASK